MNLENKTDFKRVNELYTNHKSFRGWGRKRWSIKI